jgi:hypothetical protein
MFQKQRMFRLENAGLIEKGIISEERDIADTQAEIESLTV